MKNLLILFFVTVASLSVHGQTVDKIISNYLENIGGVENLIKLKGVKITAKIKLQGFEIPAEIYQMSDGKELTLVHFQGKEMKQGVFDGEVLWSDNIMTMKPEKSDAEATANKKLDFNDFPNPFLNYKKKGYHVELLGNETIDGRETFKIKLTREPVMIDGKKQENVSFYYFDRESFVPIAVRTEITSGPGKGLTYEVSYSEYGEVGGLYFPFIIAQGIKGQPSQSIMVQKIELNPEVDSKEFSFPEENK